ncbi:MAG: radical SAM protein [Clostridiales bacterium]|nr:radical SAM protein [Clostridiales bacterium]
MQNNYIIPIFIPHLGCPNDCTFCNQKSISGQAKQVTKMEVKDTIEEYLRSFKDENAYKEVAFFGGSFTGIEKEKQEELLSVAYEYIKNKKINSIRVSTRPDYIDKDILKLLKKYGVKTIELGVQSTNDYILKRCKRGHTFEDVKKASKLIKKYHFDLGHQMMIGLPESTRLDELNTAKDLIKLKPKIVRLYPVLVIKNTQLEKEYNNKEYEPLALEQAVERCKELYYLFNSKKITVIRMGLQNTDIISDPKNASSEVVAGPYHEAFGQLVEDRIWYESILEKIKKVNTKVKEIEIEVNPVDVNNVVGHKKDNLNRFKELYDVDIKVKQSESIKVGNFEMKILKTYKDFLDD